MTNIGRVLVLSLPFAHRDTLCHTIHTGLSVDLVSRTIQEDTRELSCLWELGYEHRPDERYLEVAASLVSTHRARLRVQLETS